MTSTQRSFFLVLVGILLVSAASAQVPDSDSIPNWAVPATWSPPRPSGAVGTMTDISLALPFVGIAPCRIADTRGNGFSGQAGPPALNTGTRTFQIAGSVTGVPAQCGIPADASAVSFQFTIVFPNTAGNLIAWPGGGVLPTISVLNWSAGETALGNGTIVPLSVGGALSVRINAAVGSATGHLVIDVNGYFSHHQSDGQYLLVRATRASGGVVVGHNLSTGTNESMGVAGFGNIGVYGVTDGTIDNFSTGFFGIANSGSGKTFGGQFFSLSGSPDSAGVLGVGGGRIIPDSPLPRAGVRGESTTYGVVGVSPGAAVSGVLLENSAVVAEGFLGYAGVVNYALFGFGNYAASGTKSFVDPHPADASKVIRYVSLEGPESGTYFRGRARFQNGLARIPVPEDFRLVTHPEGLTVNVTPIGELATVAVVRMGLDEIVVKGSRNVEFSYMVNGVRKTHGDFSPIGPGTEFRPSGPDAKMPAYFTEGQKAALISNGTYNADGTVNTETARRLGWERIWEERNRPVPQPE